MVTAFVCTVALDTQGVANEEATRAAEAPFELFEGVGPSRWFRFRFRLWIFNVACVTTLWEHVVFAIVLTVGELIPEAAWTPEGMESAVFVIHTRNLWILVCVFFRFVIVTCTAVSFASQQWCNEIIRITSCSL